jgi:YYY domain-containing protein
MRDILAWALTVEALGLAALPLLRLFFHNRRDAALLSRPVGLALVAYLAWAATLLPRIPFDRRLIFFALLAVSAVSYGIHRKARASGGRSAFWGPEETRAAVWFWGATAVFLVIRAAVPEILGAEKFMDLAFFNSMTRHGAMPPLDPWMAGKTINYYYWGYLLAAVLAKLASVTPFVSYNLSVATFAGYTFVAAASLGRRLCDGSRAAAIGSGFVAVFAGNVQGAIDAIRAPFDRGFDYWHASRVIAKGDTINEFPFFTFFHADLHPHLLAFPYYLAAFVFAHRLFAGETAGDEDLATRRRRSALVYFFCAFVAGTAIAANKWNTPSIGIALALAAAFRPTGGRSLPAFPRFLRGGLLGALCFLTALVLWLPNSLTYQLPNNGLGKTTQQSGLFEFLGVWGLFFAVGIVALWPARPENEVQRRRGDLFLAAAAGAALFSGFFLRKPALLPIVFLALLALARGVRALRASDGGGPSALFASLLLLLALGMIGGCEFIYFKDSYGGQLQRMNTIFKFYLQAWPLFGIAVVVFAQRAWRIPGRRARAVRLLAAAAAAVAVLYPANAAASRLRQRQGTFSLDAMPALARRNAGDAAAIAWLEENAAGRSVVLEATGNPYQELARISSHTGLPTVMGWANHEGLWRSNDKEVNVRADLVRGFYSTADEETALEIVRKFNVSYVILGDLERATHPNADHIANFLFLESVLKGPTTVFKVRSAP